MTAKEAKQDAQKKEQADKKPKPEPPAKAVEELSEEDQELKDNLMLMVERLGDTDGAVQKLALESIKTELKSATSSMTSVPKPLKFLRPEYETIKGIYFSKCKAENQPELADVISVLATTCSGDKTRECLKFRLLGPRVDVGEWGHEYVRHLGGELAAEIKDPQESAPTDQLDGLLQQIVPYHLNHAAEPEAVDLLLEIDQLPLLTKHVDENTFQRTCLYLASCCEYLPEPEDQEVLKVAYDIYSKHKQFPNAMRMALKLNEWSLIERAFSECPDKLEQQQLCFMLARHGVQLDLESGVCAIEDDDYREKLNEIISNDKMSSYFLELARDLGVTDPKQPEDIYKTHLIEGRTPNSQMVDSARQNLASTFVNAFVNAGFGQDKLVTPETDTAGEGGAGQQTHWIFKNKDQGKLSATASLGLITMWDVDGGLTLIDRYLYSKYPHVRAGGLLAVGLVNCGVRNECDPAFALLLEPVNDPDTDVREGAILGMGLAYAGSQKASIAELLLPIVQDPEESMELVGFAALALGYVFVGSCHEECVSACLNALMLREDTHLQGAPVMFVCLALGLLFLGKQETAEATLEVTKTLSEVVREQASTILTVLAYAGSGNVLHVQQLLATVGEHIEAGDGEAWKTVHQGPAVLGVALIGMAEDLGLHMVSRALEHMLQFCDPPVRRAVPLALAMLYPSNPDLHAMDTLSRLSHDADQEVAQAAILALGIIGAGTNNSRLAGLLRGLTSYYYKEPSMLFLVRLAQGLVHMGKGLLTINPYTADRQLLTVSLAGLATVLFSALHMKSLLLGRFHFLLYCLAPAMRPRWVMTVDENLKLLPTPVRVGQAVDTVAQAGRPKSLTGFQTHTSPVLLGVGERAELASDRYLPVDDTLDGVVILRENPNFVDDNEK